MTDPIFFAPIAVGGIWFCAWVLCRIDGQLAKIASILERNRRG